MPKPPRRRRFRHTAHEPFQPLRTLLHILLLQSIYYLTATILILFTSLVSGKPFSLDLIFSWRAVRGDTTVGWTLGVVWILCGIAMIIAQLLIVARSKLVLDFSLTLTFFHTLVVSLYEHSLPASVFWWALQLVLTAIMVAGGTWACRWRELRPMSFGLPQGTSQSSGEYQMVSVESLENGDIELGASGGGAGGGSGNGGGGGGSGAGNGNGTRA